MNTRPDDRPHGRVTTVSGILSAPRFPPSRTLDRASCASRAVTRATEQRRSNVPAPDRDRGTTGNARVLAGRRSAGTMRGQETA